MNVIVITSFTEAAMLSTQTMTEEQLHNEIDFFRAEKLAKKMLDQGLITADECSRIMAECRRIFAPFLSEIL